MRRPATRDCHESSVPGVPTADTCKGKGHRQHIRLKKAAIHLRSRFQAVQYKKQWSLGSV